MTVDPYNPPDFGDTGYPSGGERIGPAWRAAWSALADGRWHSRRELTPLMQEAGGIQATTSTNLLRAARKWKILETRQTTRPDGGAGFSEYRIKQ